MTTAWCENCWDKECTGDEQYPICDSCGQQLINMVAQPVCQECIDEYLNTREWNIDICPSCMRQSMEKPRTFTEESKA